VEVHEVMVLKFGSWLQKVS